MVDDIARDRAIYHALKAADEVAAALQTHLIEEHGADPERAAPQSLSTNSLMLLRQARERLGQGLRAINADSIAKSDEISLRTRNPQPVPRPSALARAAGLLPSCYLLHSRPQAVENRSAVRRRHDVARLARRPSARVERACRTCLALISRLLAYCLDDGLSLALANLKPGTGKTTSAVWLAHVFARAGNSVLLVDADPSGSALEWSDLAAMDPRLAAPQAAFPFRIVALPSRELHRRLPDIARDDDVVIIDAPEIEDHGAIARSALRYADEIVIPCAPNPIEINRTTPVRDEIADLQAVRDRPVRSAVLLNRCVTRAHSISDARQALQDLGYDVLATAVPRLEVYAQSFGLPIPDTGRDVWRQVVRDLIERCAPPCQVRSLTAAITQLSPVRVTSLTGRCAFHRRCASQGPTSRPRPYRDAAVRWCTVAVGGAWRRCARVPCSLRARGPRA